MAGASTCAENMQALDAESCDSRETHGDDGAASRCSDAQHFEDLTPPAAHSEPRSCCLSTGDSASAAAAATDACSDISSDSENAIDFFSSADIVTSAAATWCVHEAYQETDPLVSFFAQLVSSHTVICNSNEEHSQQEKPHAHSAPGDDLALADSSPHLLTAKNNCGAESKEAKCSREEGWMGQQARPESSESVPSTSGHFKSSLSSSKPNLVNILGSIREAISDNTELFEDADEERPAQDAALGAPCSNSFVTDSLGAGQRYDTAAQCNRRREPTAPAGASRSNTEGVPAEVSAELEAFLPPPVPVNLEFCRNNPRVAVSWLVHAQVTSKRWAHASTHAPGEEGNSQKRLDADTDAQLACLVSPDCFPKYSLSRDEARKPLPNPFRQALGTTASKLVATLDAEGMLALTELLRSWYYSGLFTGQALGRSRGAPTYSRSNTEEADAPLT